MTDNATLKSKDETPRYFWTRFPTERQPTPRGEELAALRRGMGRLPGSVPEMWPYYVHLSQDGRIRRKHIALSLFGLHQQSQQSLVHAPGRRIGQALADLRGSGKFSQEAVDSRVTRAATTDDMDELAYHLRGLISQLKSTKGRNTLDYTLLVRALTDWQTPGGRDRVRREWGRDYYR